MSAQKINHLAVWICIVLYQLILILWYSPFLFANKWMNYLGKSLEDFIGESISGLVFSIVGAIAFNYFLAVLFKQLRIDGAIKGFSVAFALALCCFAFQTFTQDSFSLRPPGLSLINSGGVLLSFCLGGTILGGWTKQDLTKNKIDK